MVWIGDVTYRFPSATNSRRRPTQTVLTINALPPKFEPAMVARRNEGQNVPPL